MKQMFGQSILAKGGHDTPSYMTCSNLLNSKIKLLLLSVWRKFEDVHVNETSCCSYCMSLSLNWTDGVCSLTAILCFIIYETFNTITADGLTFQFNTHRSLQLNCHPHSDRWSRIQLCAICALTRPYSTCQACFTPSWSTQCILSLSLILCTLMSLSSGRNLRLRDDQAHH